MERKQRQEGRYYLMCERDWIYFVLIFVAGFLGAFTYVLRGGVFCNAQTGNVVLLGMELGKGDWSGALYYLIPIGAYILGAVVSELLPNPVKHRLAVRWDTLLIAVEMIVIVILGFLPESAPVQISQVAVNFIASMQYNTFRQAEGVAVATTFVTNHIRQVGVGLAMEWRHRHDAAPPQVPHPPGHAALLRGRRHHRHRVLRAVPGPRHLDHTAAARRGVRRAAARGPHQRKAACGKPEAFRPLSRALLREAPAAAAGTPRKTW